MYNADTRNEQLERKYNMAKVMLVDDDVPVVEYLQRLVPWESHALSVCAIAYSVSEAKELFMNEYPDILLTDIGLPDGNGIELAHYFRSLHPELRIVFLTCHADFHYLKEAMSIEADDYIVKDELSPNKIIQSVGKAVSKLLSAQTELEKIAYKSDVERNKDLLIQRFFLEILNASEPGLLLKQGERLGINWSLPYYMVGLCHLDIGSMLNVYHRNNLELVKYAAYNIAKELTEGTRITPVQAEGLQLWFIANLSGNKDEEMAVSGYLKQIHEKISEFLKIHCCFVISPQPVELVQLKKKVNEIIRKQQSTYYESAWMINIDGPGRQAEPKDELNITVIEPYCDKWVAALSEFNRSLVLIYASTIEKLIREKKPEARQVQDLLIRMLQQASYQLGGTMDERLQQEIKQALNLDEALEIINGFSEDFMEKKRSAYTDKQNTNPDLKVINAFIYQHIYKNVTSIDIAQYLHLNPNYFSRYFKKLAGLNFTDHVHLLKMEEAKRLLGGQNETAENVAYMLGYSDRAYFSKVFKKYTGMSPSEFKQK
jgi:two-component system response regulator YesN